MNALNRNSVLNKRDVDAIVEATARLRDEACNADADGYEMYFRNHYAYDLRREVAMPGAGAGNGGNNSNTVCGGYRWSEPALYSTALTRGMLQCAKQKCVRRLVKDFEEECA